MTPIKLIPGNCNVRIIGSTLPLNHPDGWMHVRNFNNQYAISFATYSHMIVIGGREMLLFVMEPHLQAAWAQPLSARSWASNVGAPSNRDMMQELNHVLPVRTGNL